MECEPRFVGLLRNVLSCIRKDDVPTQITETVIDDIMTDVNVLRMEDGRVEACLIWESTGIASCIQVRKENLETTRTQQYIDSNLQTPDRVAQQRMRRWQMTTERQWIRHTDLRQTGTRVKTGEGTIISSCQIHNT